MKEVKITKAEKLEMIKAIIEQAEVENKTMLIDCLNTMIAQDELKKEKAKERRVAKAAEPDELENVVKNILGTEWATAADILAQIDDAEVTKAKVIARLTKLVGAGIAEKQEAKADGKRFMQYRIVTAE